MGVREAGGSRRNRRLGPTRRSRVLWAWYAQVYDLLWDSALTREVGAQVCRHVPEGAMVLEVGAGTGLITECLAEAGHTVRATEPNRWMRSRFSKRHPDLTVDGRTIEDLDDGPSDLTEPGVTVIAVNVLHLTDDPLAALDRLRAMAGSAGRVIVVTPVPGVGIGSVVRAQRGCGDSAWHSGRFVALHALLAPLAAIAGATSGSIGIDGLPYDQSSASMRIADVSDLVVFGPSRTEGSSGEGRRTRTESQSSSSAISQRATSDTMTEGPATVPAPTPWGERL